MPKTHKRINSLKRKMVFVGAVVALILIIDQLVKIWVKTHFINEPGGGFQLLGDWFILEYIENQGMAFGTTLGNSLYHKLALSIFRIVAIGGISYYCFQQIKKGARMEFLLALSLILAGATGNLIDSMFYDYFFTFDPCMPFNHLEGSGNMHDCGFYGRIETRNHGFLLGNVVDMFKFQAYWPESFPWIGGKEVFPAIWNTADAAISIGIGMVFLRQRAYFPKEDKPKAE